MKKLKIYIVLFLTILLFGTLTVSAAATTKIATGDAEAYVGETVMVPVKISSNAGFVSASIIVEYDDSVLTLTGVNDKALISGAAHTTRFTSPYILSWENDIRASNYTVNGTLAELVFTVSSFAEPGDYDIKVGTPTHGILNSNGVEVDCSFSAGTITVHEEECSHDWSDWKKSSSTRHKRSCDLCGEVEYDSHEWDDGEVTEEATEDTTGVLTYTCDVCGATKTENIPELPSEDIFVEGVSLNKSSETMAIGDTLTLRATVTPSDATDRTVKWTSSNTSVAKVSDGIVTAVGAGKTTITVKTADGGHTASCVITVYPDPDALTLTLGEGKAVAGKTVEIKLDITNNSGIAGMGFEVGYNSDVMTLISYEGNPAWYPTSNFDEDNSNNPVSFFWSRTTDFKANSTILTLTFEIKADAPAGDYAVTLTANEKIINQKLDELSYNAVSGSITVIDYVAGDVNGDTFIDTKDAVLLAQYLARWSVSVDMNAADCNADGFVDTKDAVLLAQYLARWDVTLG